MAAEAGPGGGLFGRWRAGLGRARQGLFSKIQAAVGARPALDAAMLEALEGILLGADVGPEETERLLGELRAAFERERLTPQGVTERLRALVAADLRGAARPLAQAPEGPTVILLVGVNGSGKTTTAAKLAYRLRAEGRSTLLGAADTFRAAAAEQLGVWAGRAGVDLVRHSAGGDPSAVVFDAVSAAVARGLDSVICDTAGRLHNKAGLMAELQKMVRVAGRACPGAPHEVLLVCDAATGQNGLVAARVFLEMAAVTGVVLTKLDTTARGGIVLAVHRQLGLPILYVGVGEGLEDLRVFDPDTFASAVLGAPEA